MEYCKTSTGRTGAVFLMVIVMLTLGYSSVSSQNPLVDTVPMWVKEEGYPIEVHEITSQGYVMQVHRMPRPKRPAVLLVHGFLCSSIDWVFGGPNNSLGYVLYDAGLDVWMANLRGTPCGMKHSFLKPTQKKFWNFSFHEYGLYDIMDTTDYIMNVTGQRKIHFVGNSMGGGAILAGLSEKPHYNDKFHQVILFAPSTRLKYVTAPVARLAKHHRIIKSVADYLKINYFPMFNNNEFLKLSNKFCTIEALPRVCLPLVHSFVGTNFQPNYKEFVKVTRYYPASTSMKNVLHMMQTVGAETFSQYDYGDSENLRQYGSVTPPIYDLSRVTTPVVIFSCEADHLVKPEDIDWLKGQLPNVVKTFYIKRFDFVHLSFLWHPNITELVYLDVVKLISNTMH